MRHTRANHLLNGFRSSELSARRRARLERHLAGCPPCRARQRDSSGLDALLSAAMTSGSLPARFDRAFEPAVESVRARVLREARTAGPARRPLWRSPALGLPILSAAALLGMVLVLAPDREPLVAPPAPESLAANRAETAPAPPALLEPGDRIAPRPAPSVPRPARVRPAARNAGARKAESATVFEIARTGSDVQIVFESADRPHRVRCGSDPAEVGDSKAVLVTGAVWHEDFASGRGVTPGSVTFYLVD